MFISVIIFVITLLILVLIHELGHFLMAKKFNIKILEFGFGIPPRAWGKKWGETLVSINWLPFGGFVRLLGEDEADKKVLENKRSFAAQKVRKRILVVVAGVLMNFIFAWLLFYIVLGFQGFTSELPLFFDHKFVGANQKVESMVVVAQVSPDSPALKAGLKKGDRIIVINKEVVESSEQLSDKLKSLAGQIVELTVSDLRKQNLRTLQVTPREKPPLGEGPLGIALSGFKVANLKYQTFAQKIFSGPTHSFNLVAYSGKILSNLIGQSLSQKSFTPISSSLAGPVGITVLANDILTSAPNPAIVYLDFVALLSLNLAVINLLPIPALDGGRLFFLLIEAVIRRRIHAELEKWIHTIGMALLLTLAVLITFSDIGKLFSW